MSRIANLVLPGAAAAALSACHVVPMRSPDGTVHYEPYPLPPVGTPIPPPPPNVAPAGLPGATYTLHLGGN